MRFVSSLKTMIKLVSLQWRFGIAWLCAVVTVIAFQTPGADPGTQTQPELLLAKVYGEGIDLEQYWVSEKLDEVRAYWDGIQ